jgi:hypothetical protein
MQKFLRNARWFIEDWSIVIVPVLLAAVIVLAVLAFSGSEPDCSAQIEEAEIQLVGEMLEAFSPVIVAAEIKIQYLQNQLEAAQSGNSGVSAIRPNEELGAYSDPAGEFYCFPVEGAGFPGG